MKNIVWGVCGIGHGHCFRQMPLINMLEKQGYNIVIFSFGNSFKVLSDRFPNIKNINVFTPWIHTNSNGIDFKKTYQETINNKNNYITHNFQAMQEALDYLDNKVDLVISDYEPISAGLSFALNIPLITIDQQSKYISGEFPKLNGFSHLEESRRLNYFFPIANKRISCSFFNVPSNKKTLIIPPVLRSEFLEIKEERRTSKKESIIIYLSSYLEFHQSISEIIEELKNFDEEFIIFSSKKEIVNYKELPKNFKLNNIDNEKFFNALKTCKGVITTGGHNLLSELMYLEIPPYVCPLNNYEQNYNSYNVHHNKFGFSDLKITKENFKHYLDNLDNFKSNIINDDKVLLKGNGLETLENEVCNIL